MKFIHRVLLLVLVGMLVLPGSAGAADTVKIGLLAPLTGFAAADGLSVLNSVQLAVERVNQEGGLLGRQVELVYYDDRADGKEAVALARKLIQQDQVAGVVGGSYSTPSRAVAPIFEDEEIPFVAAYAVHPDITQAGKYCFRNGFLGMVEGKSAGYVSVELLKELDAKEKRACSPATMTSALPWPKESNPTWRTRPRAPRSSSSRPTPFPKRTSNPIWPKSRKPTPTCSLPAGIISRPAPWSSRPGKWV